jgi:hypothetical protein
MNLAMLTSENVTTEDTDRCMECFLSFHNIIRACLGVDAISEELLKAFGDVETPASKADAGERPSMLS